ncbi:ATP-binding protein [Paludisphaera sp.]|uniref:ATP-binding protein n=1 Tax=Paludisphaera sp. TaxID=2017432 RepID=UPI00301DD36E
MTTKATEPASSPGDPASSPALGAGPRRSLVARQTLFVGFLVALTAASLTTAGHLYVGGLVREQIDSRLSAIADDRQFFLLTALHREGERVTLMAGRSRLRALMDRLSRSEPEKREEKAADLRAALEEVRESARDVRAMRLETTDGAVVATSGEPADLAMIAEVAGRGDRGHLATPVPAAAGPAAVFEAEVPSRSGPLLARLRALIDLARVSAELADPRGLGETGEVLIGVPEGGSVRFLFPPREHPELIRFPLSRSLPMREAFAGRSGLTRTRDRFGREVLAAYRPLGYAGWGVMVKIDEDEAYAPVRRLRRLMTTIGATILVIGLGASYVLARRLTRPILRLAGAAEAVAEGRLDTPIAVASADEVGVLESSFARMTEELARSRADMESRIRERTADLEAVRDLLDAFFRISTAPAGERTLDRTFDSVLAFCSRLGYDLAMISLVDREAGVIRGARGGGAMAAIVAETVRPLDGGDVLARVVREGKVAIVPDSTVDPACDHEASARAGVRGLIVLPMADEGEVLGTLQVAVLDALDPTRVDLRPLETLAGHAGRALARFHQILEVRRLNEDLDRRAGELARSEAALRVQTEVLRSVLASMSEGVVVTDVEGGLPVVNPAARRILGLPPGDAAREEFWEPRTPMYPVGGREPFPADELPLSRARRGETIEAMEMLLGSPSLQRGRCLVVDARPLLDDAGAVRGGVAVFQEITARKRAELRLSVEYATARILAESETLVEAAPRILQAMAERLEWDLAVLWRIDASAGRARFLTLWRAPGVGSDGATIDEALRGHALAPGESLAGRVWEARDGLWVADLAADHPDDGRDPCRVLVAEGLRSAFGVPVTLRGDCVGVLGFFSRDERAEDADLLGMTAILGAQIGQFQDRCQMHARVVQSEKLASLGMLSASVAHEINNPLAYVSNNLAVLDRDVRALLEVLACHEPGLASLPPELVEEIRRIDEECDLAYVKENLGKLLDSTRQGVRRVADIVHNLRGFARGDRGPSGPVAVDVQDSIAAALEMIRGRLERRGIVVERQGEDVPPVAASPTQLNQVILNLLVNAMQAIDAAGRGDGRVVVETSRRDDAVVVEIRDDGCGMEPDVLAQIFDPFFTTKSAGDGTGLGLSISHGIVLDQGGRIEVESTPGEGSCFRVVLPVARDATE